MSKIMVAARGCAEPSGIQRSVVVAEESTELSLKQTSMELPLRKDATFAELAVASGLTSEEARRVERLRGIDVGDDAFFLLYCIEKMVENRRPLYTYEEIVDMHRHLG